MNKITCPKCKSCNVRDYKKGFSAGKSFLGVLIAGPIGLFAGAIGRNKIKLTCLNCGYSWSPIIKKEFNIKEKEVKKKEIKPKLQTEEERRKEIFQKTGYSASDPRFTKVRKSKKK
ncbi:hypothetical protein [Riemerella anatipestifer]|uniref:LITAF domain-containing protein n=1 Tax=Riemerella anatipestifer TaxID=34085 RepID=A0A1S7DQJ5_RIEAN|nr:hypothetical protein [Riemerella anatipestifer]AQY21382.1 hypothetical protein AB406_0424 [Riemerella anatipestifer]